jgi:4-oxalocrotonate tautomerase
MFRDPPPVYWLRQGGDKGKCYTCNFGRTTFSLKGTDVPVVCSPRRNDPWCLTVCQAGAAFAVQGFALRFWQLVIRKKEEGMPYVNIKITDEGVTKEQKAALIRGVTGLLQDILKKNPATTVVVIDEVKTDNWGIKGEQVTDLRKQPPEAL